MRSSSSVINDFMAADRRKQVLVVTITATKGGMPGRGKIAPALLPKIIDEGRLIPRLSVILTLECTRKRRHQTIRLDPTSGCQDSLDVCLDRIA